MTVHNKIIFSI